MRKVLLASLVLIPLALCAQPKKTSSKSPAVKVGSVAETGNGSPQAANGAPQASQKVEWMVDFNAAMQKAQKEKKPVLLYFTGSDWCGWCKKLDQEVFSQPDFAKQAGGQFVFVKLDFPMNQSGNEAQLQQNTKLKQQYGVTGFPTVVILDSKGAFVGETGYRSGGAKAYASFLEQLTKTPQM